MSSITSAPSHQLCHMSSITSALSHELRHISPSTAILAPATAMSVINSAGGCKVMAAPGAPTSGPGVVVSPMLPEVAAPLSAWPAGALPPELPEGAPAIGASSSEDP
eukprot:365960-Chlamydomonas_euryale.AAC.7